MTKKNTALFALLLISVLLLASCSSAPKESDVVNSRKNRAAELTDFGNSYSANGDYKQALVFFTLALDENIAADYEPGIIKSCNSAGNAALNIGETENAEKYFLQALSLSEKIDDRKSRSISSNNLGELYLRTGEYKQAEKMLEQAFAAADTKSVESAAILHNLGIALKKEEEYSKAISRFSQAAQINESHKKHAELAANYYMIASVHSKEKSYENAESFLLKALEEDKIVENSYGIGKDQKALGIVNEKKGNLETAYGYYLKSYMVFDVLKKNNEIRQLLAKLSETAAILGREKDSAYFSSVLKNYADADEADSVSNDPEDSIE